MVALEYREQAVVVDSLSVALPQGITVYTAGRAEIGDDIRAELEAIYRELDEIGTREVETVSHRPKRDLFHWPLGLFFCVGIFYHAGRLAWSRLVMQNGNDR